MKSHFFMFQRFDGMTMVAEMLVRIVSEDAKSSEAMDRLAGACEAFLTTDAGRQADKYAGGQFNIGDFATYADAPEMQSALKDAGLRVDIVDVAIEDYDKVLATVDYDDEEDADG